MFIKWLWSIWNNDEPYFDSKVVSLLDRGFLFCTAHIRGNGFMEINGIKMENY